MVRSRARKKSHDGGFILAACARNLLGPLVRAHVSRLATDEGFIRLNLPGQLVTRSHAQREPDAVIHEPCGLPVIFSARLSARMFRALPPMKVSSASTCPDSLLPGPMRSEERRVGKECR